MVTLNCSIGYQNLEGLHSDLHGCKLQNCINLTCDIEIFAETWTSCEKCLTISTPGYHLLENIKPQKKGSKGRSSGGLLIYCKDSLEDSIKVLKSSEKYAWLELNENLFHDSAQNIKLCAIYSQPYSSKYYRESVWSDLEADIISLSTDTTPFCIVGDMNARTGTRPDFEEDRNDPYLRFKPYNINKIARKSCDTTMNKVGEIILQLCNSYDMQIANGRTKGDILGNFTHFNKNVGQSTVDLALVSDDLFPKLEDFKVLPQNFYSDHCKIILSLTNFRPGEASTENYEWQPLQKTYKWTDESPLKYLNALNSLDIDNLLDNCSQHIEAGLIESSGVLLQKIFQKSADMTLESKKPNVNIQGSKRRKKTLKKWFDGDCTRLKAFTNKMAKLKNTNPSNSTIQRHKLALKDFSKTCKKKKNDF